MKTNARKLAVAAANQNRERHIKRSAQRQLQVDRQNAHAGSYGGYDADRGQHKVTLKDGSVVWNESITNGGTAIGQQVSVTRPRGSTTGFMKAMPR